MARLFGFVGNRPDLGSRMLELEASALRVRARGVTLGWGLGFYQAGEVLLRRRPIDERPEIDVAALASDIRADVLIGHVRAATVGNLRAENTHPFRYRQWLLAHTGTVDSYPKLRERLLDSLPEFLRRNVRGDTDSELLFHLFLSFLHDAGKLADPSVRPEATRAALRSTLSLLERLRAQEGHTDGKMNLLVTDGEHMVAVHRTATMAYLVVNGAPDLERLLGQDTLRRIRIPDMGTCKLCLIASDFDEEPRDWTRVAADSVVTITRSDDPVLEAV